MDHLLTHSLKSQVQNIPTGYAWVSVLSKHHFSRIIRVLSTEEGEIDIR